MAKKKTAGIGLSRENESLRVRCHLAEKENIRRRGESAMTEAIPGTTDFAAATTTA